ncbi:MAG TPA: methyltransferase domain-containing protein [Ramlibacter sp.]|jgi:precorrin-6B methylase 2|uniref:class I SAM-dependent methyltransferase n=1 Tax=Ramlibacter sp. TaxID=1917967 RepID=UPI002D3D85DD|nr:methyltransferase domain-containing protein [Ramlibacter sp.]HZY17888.1 methyltransferase domain-containing protein [Ramlibacter sp.]
MTRSAHAARADRTRRLLCQALALVLAGGARSGRAGDEGRYRSGPASPDGTGRFYMGREIAGVMDWQGAAWLERQEREREERTDLLLRALALHPGMVVADVGAGTGYLARRMAPLVDPQGLVLAVDVQPQMLRLLEEMARREGLGNIRTVQAQERSSGLAPASIDLAVLVDVYHELAWPHEVMDSVVQALRPGGRVVLVEYRAEDARVPIKPLHRMSEAQVRREMATLALVHERTIGTLPWQHVLVFRRRGE